MSGNSGVDLSPICSYRITINGAIGSMLDIKQSIFLNLPQNISTIILSDISHYLSMIHMNTEYAASKGLISSDAVGLVALLKLWPTNPVPSAELISTVGQFQSYLLTLKDVLASK